MIMRIMRMVMMRSVTNGWGEQQLGQKIWIACSISLPNAHPTVFFIIRTTIGIIIIIQSILYPNLTRWG